MSEIPVEPDIDYLRRIEDEEKALIFAQADREGGIASYRAALGVDPDAVTAFWREWLTDCFGDHMPRRAVAIAVKAFSLGVVVGRDLSDEETP